MLAHRQALEAQLLRTPPDAVQPGSALLALAIGQGQRAYQRHCASCHGRDLRGDPLRGVPNLIDDDWLYGSGRASEIERTVLYGIRAGNSKGWDLASMPAFGTPVPYQRYAVTPLTPIQIEEVLQYILQFQGAATDMEAAARGEKLFHNTEVGTCADCHSFDGKGDASIGAPNVTDAIWLRGRGTPGDIRETIERGLSQSCPSWIGRLSMVEIRSLAVYLHVAASQHTGQPSARGEHS